MGKKSMKYNNIMKIHCTANKPPNLSHLLFHLLASPYPASVVPWPHPYKAPYQPISTKPNLLTYSLAIPSESPSSNPRICSNVTTLNDLKPIREKM